MGVLAEISKSVLRATKRRFRVHHPFGAKQRPKPCRETFPILKRGHCAVEAEFVVWMQFFEAVHKLAPEHFGEKIYRKEESPLRVDPPRVVRSQTAGWCHSH